MPPVSALFALQGDPLPPDALTVAYEAFEGISQPYQVSVTFYTQDATFDVRDCLRKPLLFTVQDDRQQSRNYHGVVDRAEFVRLVTDRYCFRVRLRPALAALAHRENCRIFQMKNLQEICNTIFEEAGFKDKVEWRLTGTYDILEYVVQYRESELNFISRLFEDNGIFYFFKHGPDGHTMIICDDDQSAFVPQDDAPMVPFSLTPQALGEGEPLRTFVRSRSLRTYSAELRDYDFEKPKVRPLASQPGQDKFPSPYYEYPGGFVKAQLGKRKALARMRELRRDAAACSGESDALGLRPGVPFSLSGASEEFLNGQYTCTELASSGIQNPDDATENYACQNHFRGIPDKALFSPPRSSVRPRIHGVQTAIVTGPGTDEQAIHTDEYGRIKIRFHWDRINQQNDTSSCWVRVAQANMGGSMVLPRVGWEVSVCFLDGDPDRPLVLGRLYNAEKTLPYSLPGAKASSSLKSMSSPGAGGHNEINMGDSGGSQGNGITAQKDLNIKTGNNKKETVAVDEEHNVHTNMSNSVGADETISVTGNQTVNIGAVLSHKIDAGQEISVSGNDTSNATSNFVEKVGGARHYTIHGRQMVLQNAIKCTVTGNFSRTVGAVHLNGSVASISDNLLADYNSHVGAATIILCKGTFGETVGGDKNQLSLAAELHLLKGGLNMSCDAAVKHMIGGLHYEKLDGDYTVKAQSIKLVGATGTFKGGSSTLKLGGGPIVVKGGTMALTGEMIVKMGGSLKMGSGG